MVNINKLVKIKSGRAFFNILSNNWLALEMQTSTDWKAYEVATLF